jgi:hypothetical protein
MPSRNLSLTLTAALLFSLIFGQVPAWAGAG